MGAYRPIGLVTGDAPLLQSVEESEGRARTFGSADDCSMADLCAEGRFHRDKRSIERDEGFPIRRSCPPTCRVDGLDSGLALEGAEAIEVACPTHKRVGFRHHDLVPEAGILLLKRHVDAIGIT